MSSSSQNPPPVSATKAFAELAAAIDRRVSTDRAADLLADFRAAVRAEAFAEAAADLDAFHDDKTTSEMYHAGLRSASRRIRNMVEGGTR